MVITKLKKTEASNNPKVILLRGWSGLAFPRKLLDVRWDAYKREEEREKDERRREARDVREREKEERRDREERIAIVYHI